MSDKITFRQSVRDYVNAVRNKKDDTVCLVWVRDQNSYQHWTRKQVTDNQLSLNSRTNHMVMWLTVPEAGALLKQFELPLQGVL